MPVRTTLPLLVFEIIHQPQKLGEAPVPRAEVQMQVNYRQAPAGEINFRKKKPFFAEAALAKCDIFPFENWVAGQQGIAIIKMNAPHTAIVDAEYGVRKSGVLAKKFEMIEASRPSGILVDFLQRHDIGFEARQQMGDSFQALAKTPARRKT